MRASRLLSILILLQVRGRLSAEALSREFEVSVRTIYRDIDQLSAAGVPIYAERGRTGGFALLDGYRTKLTGLTAGEAEALPFAGVIGAASDLGLGAEAAAAHLKMLASLPRDSSASAHRVAARFHLDPANWYARSESNAFLPLIASAVWTEKRIRVRYESWTDVVTRTLDPLGLVMKGGRWYLVAAVDAKPRTYRVSKIHDLEPLNTSARRPPRFDLARYWAAWLKDFETRLLREQGVVKLSPRGREWLREVSPAAADAVDVNHKPCKPDGWIKATIPFENIPYATRQILSLGAEAEVLEPKALRIAVAQAAARIGARHRARR